MVSLIYGDPSMLLFMTCLTCDDSQYMYMCTNHNVFHEKYRMCNWREVNAQSILSYLRYRLLRGSGGILQSSVYVTSFLIIAQ